MNNTQEESTIVQDIYDNYTETQKEIYSLETKKTRKVIITMAIIIFLVDLLAVSRQDGLNIQTVSIVLIVPAIFIGLAFLAMREPMVAILLSSLILLAIWAYAVIILGPSGLISGWLIKSVLIFLMFAGIQNARTAQAIKRELKL